MCEVHQRSSDLISAELLMRPVLIVWILLLKKLTKLWQRLLLSEVDVGSDAAIR